MESAPHKATRLLVALEELVREETGLIRTMDFVEAVTIRERAGPLVGELCALASQLTAGALQPRLDDVLERSRQNFHFLESQLARMQTELNRVSEARGRLSQVAPAYRPQKSTTPFAQSRLNTAA